MSELAAAKAEDLLSSVMKGKEIRDLFAKKMDIQLTINGQTLEYWQTHFYLEVPYDNLNPGICKELDLKLLNLNQEAHLYYAIANARIQSMERGNESLYRQRFNKIVGEYKARNEKLPAHATLDTLANAETDEIVSAKAFFEIEKSFWKDILDHLNTIRKILENATWNNKADHDMKFASNYGGEHNV